MALVAPQIMLKLHEDLHHIDIYRIVPITFTYRSILISTDGKSQFIYVRFHFSFPSIFNLLDIE